MLLAFAAQYRQSAKKQIHYKDGFVHYDKDQLTVLCPLLIKLLDANHRVLERLSNVQHDHVLEGTEIPSKLYTFIVGDPSNQAAKDHVSTLPLQEHRPSYPLTCARKRPAISQNDQQVLLKRRQLTPSITVTYSSVARFRVLWTDQKLKKHKTWDDGTCVLLSNNRLELYKPNVDRSLDSMFVVKVPKVGDEISFDRVMVTIEERIDPTEHDSVTSSPAPIAEIPSNAVHALVPTNHRKFTTPLRPNSRTKDILTRVSDQVNSLAVNQFSSTSLLVTCPQLNRTGSDKFITPSHQPLNTLIRPTKVIAAAVPPSQAANASIHQCQSSGPASGNIALDSTDMCHSEPTTDTAERSVAHTLNQLPVPIQNKVTLAPIFTRGPSKENTRGTKFVPPMGKSGRGMNQQKSRTAMITFGGWLRFRSNWAKCRRKQVIPDSFASLEQYTSIFQSAILEHVQAQVSSFANTYFRVIEQRSSRRKHMSDDELQSICRTNGIAMHTRASFRKHSSMAGGGILVLNFADRMSAYTKDELWVVSTTTDFSHAHFLSSTYFGASNGVDMRPLRPFHPDSTDLFYAIRLFQCNDLALITHLHASVEQIPLAPLMLDYSKNSSVENQLLREGYFSIIPNETYRQLLTSLANEYNLNTDQGTALKKWAEKLRHPGSSITLIQGVFGSGKSHLVTVMVLFFYKAITILASIQSTELDDLPADLRLLISCNTNVAVDRILESLLAKQFPSFVRIGNLKRISKTVLPRTAGSKKQDDIRDFQEQLSHLEDDNERQRVIDQIRTNALSTSKIVGATCLSTLLECMDHELFGLVILDECSQLTEPMSILPLRFGARHLVCIGDPKQLPPTLESECSHPDHLEKTLFVRLENGGCPVERLSTQYRCHPGISQIPNSLFYSNTLIDGVKDRPVLIPNLPPVIFVDVSGAPGASEKSPPFTNSYMNAGEARELSDLYLLLTHRISVVSERDVGIISMYRPQADQLRTELFPDHGRPPLYPGSSRNGEPFGTYPGLVSTVDAFQGQERNIMLVSLVRSSKVGFLDDPRRVNVMLTRACHNLVIFGNAPLMHQSSLWKKVLDQCVVMPAAKFRTFVRKVLLPLNKVPLDEPKELCATTPKHSFRVPTFTKSKIAPVELISHRDEERAEHTLTMNHENVPQSILSPNTHLPDVEMNSISDSALNPCRTNAVDCMWEQGPKIDDSRTSPDESYWRSLLEGNEAMVRWSPELDLLAAYAKPNELIQALVGTKWDSVSRLFATADQG